jgi:hypothetical protein
VAASSATLVDAVTGEPRTPYDVAVSADRAGYARARMDLTPTEVALLERIAGRLDGGGVDAPRFTVEVPHPLLARGGWVDGPQIHLEETVIRPRAQVIPVEPQP